MRVVLVDNRRQEPNFNSSKQSMTDILLVTLQKFSQCCVDGEKNVEQARQMCISSSDVIIFSGSDLSLTDPCTFPKIQHAFVILLKAMSTPQAPRILGICFGYQLLAWVSGRRILKMKQRHCNAAERIDDGSVVYFNHRDCVEGDREGTKTCTSAFLSSLPWTGVQWHPEGTKDGCKWLLAWVGRANQKKNETKVGCG